MKRKQYSAAEKLLAQLKYLAGDSTKDVAKAMGCSPRTVRDWAANGGWSAQLKQRRETVVFLEQQINTLSQQPTVDHKSVLILAMLTKSLDRVKKSIPQPHIKPTPKVQQAISSDLLNHVVSDEYGLYQFQRDFITTDARFIKTIKARQVGFSFTLGLKALLTAMSTGRSQLIISASERQSQTVLKYARHHMSKLEVTELGKPSGKVIELPNGAEIIALPQNFRSIQGNPGDVIFDEFAWYHRPKQIWDALVPSITQVGGTVTVCSTPFVPGNMFWKVITGYQNRYTNFEMFQVSIHDAVAQGMAVPGGLDELRSLFDSESWAMLYECQWAEDGSALLSWDKLLEIATVEERRIWTDKVNVGVDVGSINDKFSMAKLGKLNQGHDPAFRLLHYDSYKGWDEPKQLDFCRGTFRSYDVANMLIDRTGQGLGLYQHLVKDFPDRVRGIAFSFESKSDMALNLLRLIENNRFFIINDPYLIAQMHKIKKSAKSKGISYDAEHDEEGHADEFWAIALAALGATTIGTSRPVAELW